QKVQEPVEGASQMEAIGRARPAHRLAEEWQIFRDF
ncbi:hypothetical protein CEXT_720381, partial [Caerostris extrusa]